MRMLTVVGVDCKTRAQRRDDNSLCVNAVELTTLGNVWTAIDRGKTISDYLIGRDSSRQY